MAASNEAVPPRSLRDQALAIWQAGVDAVRGDRLMQQCVGATPEGLEIDGRPYPIPEHGRLLVVGAGKAAAAMAEGFEQALGPQQATRFSLGGWVNVPDGTQRPLQHIHLHAARPAGQNEPTERAVQGTEQILRLVGSAAPDDLCVVLLSGGGSALLPAPIAGITLADKLAVTRLLSSAGANIEQLNTVRKPLSRIKGGGLAAACSARRMVTLIISDVLGDPLDVIASGPTVASRSTAEDALRVLAQFDPQRTLPAAVYHALQQQQRQGGVLAGRHQGSADAAPTPRGTATQVENIIVANNAVAVDAAGITAERLGLSHAMQSARQCEGAAEQIGRHLADMAVMMLRSDGPDCLITGGEPTVQLAAEPLRGRGGRNQQLVLAALARLRQRDELSDRDLQRLVILSGGTDGEDGPTDAAGAVVDAEVAAAAAHAQLDIDDALRRNDAYSYFDRCGGLLRTGPTHTNVCDLRVVVVQRSGE